MIEWLAMLWFIFWLIAFVWVYLGDLPHKIGGAFERQREVETQIQMAQFQIDPTAPRR